MRSASAARAVAFCYTTAALTSLAPALPVEGTERPADVAPARTGERLVAIDVLRGVAVLVVVLCHLPIAWADLGAHPGPGLTMARPLRIALEYGRVGVHLFLVLSGFCIHLAWARTGDVARGIDFGAFWRKRLRRLYPPYLAALGLTLAVAFVLHAVLGDAAPASARAFGYASAWTLAFDLGLLLLLAQNLTLASHRVGNGPFWSLGLEEQLYVLYFALLSVRRRLGWRAVFAMTLTVTLLFRGALLVAREDLPETWLGIGPSRWFEWALGAYAVEAHRGHVTLPRWATQPLAFVLLLALAIFVTPAAGTWTVPAWVVVIRDPLFGLAFFVLVNALCRADLARWGTAIAPWAKGAAALGVVSYSVYLVHTPLIVLATRLAVRDGVDDLLTLTVMRFGVALLGGLLFFKLVESRFLGGSRAAR